MNKSYRIFLFFFFTVVSPSLYSKNLAKPMRYCVPVDKINLSPFREIKDGKDLAYLLLLRTYISSIKDEPGILEAYEFSPDGKLFRGRVNPSLTWPDGTSVSAKEAALGIVKGFLFRPIGERVKIIGCERIGESDFCDGMKIVNDSTFELKLESTIENLTGVVREALSSGSRHNRVWPVHYSLSTGEVHYLGKVELSFTEFNPVFRVGAENVALVGLDRCKNADFTLYPEAIDGDISGYDGLMNSNPQAITLQLNTKNLSKIQRRAVSAWIRKSFQNLPETSGIKGVSSFFLEGESGYQGKSLWDKPYNVRVLRALRNMRLQLGVEIPVFRKILSAEAKQDGINLELIDFPLKKAPFHGQVLSSGIHDGRQIILQDILKWNYALDLFGKAPKTQKALEIIAGKSASTIPPDNITLQNFESVAIEETSLIPIGRRYVKAYSKKSLPIALEWSKTGELEFVKKPPPQKKD